MALYRDYVRRMVAFADALSHSEDVSVFHPVTKCSNQPYQVPTSKGDKEMQGNPYKMVTMVGLAGVIAMWVIAQVQAITGFALFFVFMLLAWIAGPIG